MPRQVQRWISVMGRAWPNLRSISRTFREQSLARSEPGRFEFDLILSLSKDEVVHGAWVYILKCADGMYYVGSHRGEDPSTRAAEHNHGADPKAFTYQRRPVVLIWAEHFEQIIDAIAWERRLKGWSRAKKEAVIRGDWDALPELSRSRNPRPSTSSG